MIITIYSVKKEKTRKVNTTYSMWKKIEKIMQEKNISTYRLSKMTGISKQYFSQMKLKQTDNPSFETVCKIADALEVDINESEKNKKSSLCRVS
ncbi:helix-turn-helix domain-containing protein [Lactococcus garvieae]|uniref:helix-turn-helix domain-containing protein n=1 Tax=Lactococcus garvieae TaxID=1363 RepID=UPI001ED9436E|nr:helix-turn-helix transcriptional regulator [Lactococcus garvieae]